MFEVTLKCVILCSLLYNVEFTNGFCILWTLPNFPACTYHSVHWEPTNNSAQLHSNLNSQNISQTWAVNCFVNQLLDKKKAGDGNQLIYLTCSIHFSPVCLTRPPVSWMRARAPRAEWSSRQSSAPRYDHQFIWRHDFSACDSHYHLLTYTVLLLHNIYKRYSIFYMKLVLYYMHCIKY